MARNRGVWKQTGFQELTRGTCGNAGQNFYVSRSGVLQRIHRYDFTGNGHVDLVFCNSQSHCERPPAYVYAQPLDGGPPLELASDGARSGALADLTGNGYDDIVLGMGYDGIREDLNAFVYFGSSEGYGERRHLRLSAPACLSTAAGDLNGDGRPDLAFLLAGGLRVFYQSELGLEPKRFVDLPIRGAQIAIHDVDGDGSDDLIVRSDTGQVHVYWGGDGGIDPDNASMAAADQEADKPDAASAYAEYVCDATPLAGVVTLAGVPHLFCARKEAALLIPVRPDRTFGPPLRLECSAAMAVAVGDIHDDGGEDIVVACREPHSGRERSWIYWGGPDGYRETRRTPLSSFRACDVAVGDLDGNGYDDIVLCQSHTAESFTSCSLIYRGSPEGIIPEPIELASHDARRAFLARGPAASLPQIVLVNMFSGNKLGDVDVSIYVGDDDGYSADRRMSVAGWGAVEALCCDINDDGRTDLVLANASENSIARDPGSFLFYAGSGGLPHEPSLILPTTRAHGACCADIDRDGYLDLIFVGFDSPDMLVFHGGPNGFDAAPHRIRLEHEGVVYSEPRWIYLADLDNDGWLDLVVPQITADRSFILWGGPDGFSMERCQVLSVERAACARAADLTGNGYLDLILGGHNPTRAMPHDSFVYIYWNGPEGLSQDRRTMLPAVGINSMAVADFNRDGWLDLFVCSYHDGKARDIDSYIYWNREGRGFSAADRTRLFTHSASACFAADFNEDGWVDLAVANHKVWGDHEGYSEVWWNGPDGFDPRRTTRLPTSGPHGMTAVGPRNLMSGGDAEYYESVAHQLPEGAVPTSVSWQADVPPKTWVKAQLRSADTREGLDAAPWAGADGPGTWLTNGQALPHETRHGEWIQFRLALGATNGVSTPRVTEISVEYRK